MQQLHLLKEVIVHEFLDNGLHLFWCPFSFAIGLAEIAAGLFCIFQYEWFIMTFPLLTILYGIVILLTAFSKIQWTVDMIWMHQKKWYLAAISAVVSLICAVFL